MIVAAEQRYRGSAMEDYEQLVLFASQEGQEKKTSKKLTLGQISQKALEGFIETSIPFIGCDYKEVYPTLSTILPKEKIVFSDFPLRIAIICEMLCSAICHQINWDFLRKVVRDRTIMSFEWLSPVHLSEISEDEVSELLSGYSKPERVQKKERAALLHSLGRWLSKYDPVEQVFLEKDKGLLPFEKIEEKILECEVFSNDPEKKKVRLLIQKLSALYGLEGLAQYYQPAIDYHLVRVYLRRGLIIAKTQYANNLLEDLGTERKESTMGAIRQLCAHTLSEISEYTGLDISTVNQIEWCIGRSVCVPEEPDCFLQSKESQWLNESFRVCPFFNTCAARTNKRFLGFEEPTYKGYSY